MAGLTLYILRHAHAVHDPSYADFDRPLTAEGTHEAAAVGRLMQARGDRPARILCSTAQRTRETLTGVLSAFLHDASVELTRGAYNADVRRLLELVAAEAAPSLMLIGHNPGLEDLARGLAGLGDPKAARRLREKFPPAALAVISFEATGWADVEPGKGTLTAFDVPA